MNVGTMTIKSRRSVRKYKPSTIPPYVIQDVLDCGRLAPTAKNLQPWLFGAVTDRELLRRIAELTDNAPFIADAAVCFAVFGRPDETYYLEDCAAATMSMIIALQNLGLGELLGGRRQEAVRRGDPRSPQRPRRVFARLPDPCRRPGGDRESAEEAAPGGLVPGPVRRDRRVTTAILVEGTGRHPRLLFRARR